MYELIPTCLKENGMNVAGSEDGWRRVIVEKPFGTSLESAERLNKHLIHIFDEKEIYRIDHYLGKETVQNILVLRFSNGIFEPLWNRNYIDSIEISASETLGVENRGKYYDGAGALRDMIQNHLMQLMAFTAMESPSVFDPEPIRDEIVKVFRAIHRYSPTEIWNDVIRAQYTGRTVGGTALPGYREEKGVAADSTTETYVAMKLFIDNWRWGGVPFYIRTGKQMPTKVSEIVIHFKPAPYSLFRCEGGTCPVPNRLVIRIQPNEGIVLRLGMKKPGEGFEVLPMDMDFSYAELGRLPTEDAYARLIEDCIAGDPTLFIRSDAVESGWRFFDPILKYWQDVPECPLYGYPAGSWGPLEADSLVARQGASWTNPCKNLTNTHLYCEL